LTIINRKTIVNIVALYLIALGSSWLCFTAQAQTATTFAPADKFPIPAYNSSISFATNGTYEQAFLENNTWHFVNLQVNDTGSVKNLTATAQNSNVEITAYQGFGTSSTATLLAYNVVGQGTQSFNFGINTAEWGWSVILDNEFMADNEGYTISPDQTITVTDATVNATIFFFPNLDVFGGTSENPDQPFYMQHRVAIATGITVAIVVALALIIRRRKQEGKQ